MAKKYFVVHFSGHGETRKAGQRDNSTFNNLAPLLSLRQDVSRFSFWAGLGDKSSKDVANKVYSEAKAYAGGSIDDITFIIHGYSAGGVTALHFAYLIPNDQIVYIGLSDAAFYRNDTDYLMQNPGSTAYHSSDNYYQIRENKSHQKVFGFTNIEVRAPNLSPGSFSTYHTQAVNYADGKIFDKMKSIIQSGL
jgi:hypothetical protein